MVWPLMASGFNVPSGSLLSIVIIGSRTSLWLYSSHCFYSTWSHRAGNLSPDKTISSPHKGGPHFEEGCETSSTQFVGRWAAAKRRAVADWPIRLSPQLEVSNPHTSMRRHRILCPRSLQTKCRAYASLGYCLWR